LARLSKRRLHRSISRVSRKDRRGGPSVADDGDLARPFRPHAVSEVSEHLHLLSGRSGLLF